MTTCRKCGAEMKAGIAIGQTFTACEPDFADNDIRAINAGGPGEVIPCLKCPACGWSVTRVEED